MLWGRWWFGDQRGGWGASREETAAIVKRYAQAAGNFIDTANHYAAGESEQIVGELIAPDRDRWVLATKYTLSADADDPNAGGSHRKSLRRAIDASLERLGTDYIDLYRVHVWDAFAPVEGVIRALEIWSGRAWCSTSGSLTRRPGLSRERLRLPSSKA